MHSQAYLLLAISIPNFVLGFFVLTRNVRNPVNVSFAGLALTTALWSLGLAGFILSNRTSAALNWAKEYYTAASLIAVFFLAFSASFTGYWSKERRLILPTLPLAILVNLALILGSPRWLLTGVRYHSWGKEVVLQGTGYVLFSIIFSVLVIAGFAFIYKAFTQSRGLFKSYLQYLFIGLILAFSLGMLFNLVYPAFGNYQYIWVGPLFTVTYISFVSYAIVRHKLFDIHSAVARSLGYVITLVAIGFLGALPALLAAGYLTDTKLGVDKLSIFAVIYLATALIYQWSRPFFNRITYRIFYRDYYDPQDVLDRLSNLLVGSVDLEEIKSKSAAILHDNIKPFWVRFALSTESADQHLLKALTNSHSNMVIFDDLNLRSHADLHQTMGEASAAVAVRLQTKHENLGYLLLGFKQSGSPYSATDQKLLSIAADEIAISLQNALRFDEIQRFNVTLQEKVDEATKQLRQANHRLRELDATKDEFISMASHQLRTPLTTIKGYLSMVLEGDVGTVNKKEQEMIQQAFDSAERMVFLIADLLNVSRLQSGKFVIDNKPTDLAQMVETEVGQLKDTAANHHLTLTYKKPEKFPALNLDDMKIRQVVMNFMDNAIYYTPAGGSIEVGLEADEKTVNFTVTDTGLGVPKAEQHHLFSKFYRAGNARKMRPDGTGLGLFMAKKVITAQGGAIIFKSEEGKGSTFGFSFPRVQMEVKGQPAQPDKTSESETAPQKAAEAEKAPA